MLTLKSSPACTSSGDDEANVEWFNQMLFEDEYTINVSQSATSFMVQLNCPQPISPALPPSLGVNLSPFDTITSTSCNSGTPLSINIQGAMSGLYPYCSYQNSVVTCDFEVQAVNTETRLTYSETMMSIQFISLPSQIVPQLLPATVPLGLNCAP